MTLSELADNRAYPPLKPKKRLSQRLKKSWKDNKIVYIVLTPIMIHFLIFQLFPLLFSFVLSFMNWPVIGTPSFAGFDNWKRLFSDELAWRALWNTVLFSIYYIIPTMALGLTLALLINSGLKVSGFFKAIYFLPVVTAFVIICGIWIWMFKGSEDGLMNSILGLVGIDPQLFFGDVKMALPLLATISIFKVSGSTMVYYFAGLKSIPTHLYEAAHIDGAGPWRRFWNVTFPLLMPTHFYVAIITTIGSFQIFDSAYLVTDGGPNYATTTIVLYLYRVAFNELSMGYASVLSYILFAVILTISLIQRKYFGKEISYY